MEMANKYFDTDVWQPVTLGIGGQQPIFITRDNIDGQLAFFSTKEGGLYKSVDGGHNWKLCENGIATRTTTGVQIDPKNKNHVITVGSFDYFYLNGIYVSWDEGENWTQTLRASATGSGEQRYQIAFDPTSYDEKLGGCAVVYWARSSNPQKKGHNHPALYKSVDGGNTWQELENTSQFGNCSIRVHSQNGWLYLANCVGVFGDDRQLEGGLWCSKDKGKTFEKLDDEVSYWFEVGQSQPDNIYLVTDKGIKLSRDCGKTFTYIKGENYPQHPRFLSVSPANADNMMIFNHSGNNDTPTYFYSNDGGKKWSEAKIDIDYSCDECAYRQRQSAWSPDGKSVLTFGGDFILRSDDMGKSFTLSNDGFDAARIDSDIGYNINNPNNIFVATRDYNGRFSTDGGKTWNSINWTKDTPGKSTYGGYCWNELEMCCGVDVSAPDKASGSEVEILVTHDGGKTIERTGVIVKGAKRCMAVRYDDDTVFFGEWKTTNKGYSWTKMTDQKGDMLFDCVMAYDFSTSRMFAVRKGNVLQSYDCFNTYDVIAKFAGASAGISFDHINKKLYLAMDNHLYVIDDKTLQLERCDCASNMENHVFIRQVYVNDKNVNMIYTGSWGRQDFNSDSVFRSLDGGKTWTPISKMPFPRSMFVNTLTNEVFAEFECRGIWKMKLPEVE